MLKLKPQYLGYMMRTADYRKRPWCWERLRAGGEGDDRGWDGWMASLTQWIWVWVNSGSQWRIGKPGVLQFIGLRRVGHDLVSKQQISKDKINSIQFSWKYTKTKNSLALQNLLLGTGYLFENRYVNCEKYCRAGWLVAQSCPTL